MKNVANENTYVYKHHPFDSNRDASLWVSQLNPLQSKCNPLLVYVPPKSNRCTTADCETRSSCPPRYAPCRTQCAPHRSPATSACLYRDRGPTCLVSNLTKPIGGGDEFQLTILGRWHQCSKKKKKKKAIRHHCQSPFVDKLDANVRPEKSNQIIISLAVKKKVGHNNKGYPYYDYVGRLPEIELRTTRTLQRHSSFSHPSSESHAILIRRNRTPLF